MTHLDHSAITSAYLNGALVSTIATDHDCTTDAVRYILRRRGVAGMRDDRYGNNFHTLGKTAHSKIITLRRQGYGYSAIGKALDISSATARKVTLRHKDETGEDLTDVCDYNKPDPELHARIRRLRAQGLSYNRIAREVGCSHGTAYNVARDVEVAS